MPLPAALFALAAFSCPVVHVADGDTFTCADRTRVRIAAIDAPELPGHCRRGRQCAPGDPFAAKVSMEQLVLGRTLQCEPTGTSYDRIVAWCRVGRVDVGCAQVSSGHAIREDRYDGADVCRRRSLIGDARSVVPKTDSHKVRS